MNDRMLSEKFGLMLMEGEHLIEEIKPTNSFARLFAITSCLTIVGIIAAPFVYFGALIAQDKFRYWLTNRRVILASGFIGHRIRSVPLERVSDVALSSTFPEMLAGTKSVIVRDMTGEAQSGKSLLAIDNAGDIQRRILEEVQRVNSEKRSI
jgi:uncharacterized membrane protein YdbT with pleckstrin-like domain